MSDLSETYQAMKEHSRKKKLSNIEKSRDILLKSKIVFEEKNDGTHFIVNDFGIKADFWPSTGKWIIRRNGKKGRGVFNLLKAMGF